MAENERKDYRRMLNVAKSEFEEMWRYCTFSDKACKSLFFRICKVLATHDKSLSKERKAEKDRYFSRKDVLEVLNHRSEKEIITAELARLKGALGNIATLENNRRKKGIGYDDEIYQIAVLFRETEPSQEPNNG